MFFNTLIRSLFYLFIILFCYHGVQSKIQNAINIVQINGFNHTKQTVISNASKEIFKEHSKQDDEKSQTLISTSSLLEAPSLEIEIVKSLDSNKDIKWSKWGRCTKKCLQKRRRRCGKKRNCKHKPKKEQRPCIGGKCSQTTSTKSNQDSLNDSDDEKSTLETEADDLNNNSTEEVTDSNHQFKIVRRTKSSDMHKYNPMFYSRWTPWGSCSSLCKTARIRWCKFNFFCGGSIIREEAYCYSPGGRCERNYQTQEQNVLPRDPFSIFTNRLFNHNSIFDDETRDPFHDIFNRHDIFRRPSSLFSNRNPVNNSPILSGNSGRIAPTGNAASSVPDESTINENKLQAQRTNSSNADEISNVNATSTSPRNAVCGQIPLSIGNHLLDEASENRRPVSNRRLKLKILGGHEAARGHWPWQVIILNRHRLPFCGGVIIAPKWILSAAHCVRRRLYVTLAEHDLTLSEGTERQFRIRSTFPHPKYNPLTVDNDVAMLMLPHSVDYTPYIAPVCLPPYHARLPVGQKCTIIGWGKERSTHLYGTDRLHQAEVPIVNSNSCRAVYWEYSITSNMFCAGYRSGHVDSCAGDSGGPLLCQIDEAWYVFGITSFGEGCGKQGKYGIYARVSNYRMWIDSLMREHELGGHNRHRHNRGRRNRHRHDRRGVGLAIDEFPVFGIAVK